MEQQFEGSLGRLHRGIIGLTNRVWAPDHPLRRRASHLYSTGLYALSGGRGLPGVINGETFRLDPRYRWMLWPDYEASAAAFLRERISPGQCCVNVGANVGVYVLQMSRWVGPTGHVVAFEPNPNSFEVLARHVRMNGLQARVTLEPSAAGRAAGTARMFDLNAGSGLSRLEAPNPAIVHPAASTDVPVVSLDEYFASSPHRPDWVKIDVEGFEFDVLAGAERLLADPGLSVVVEMHPHLWRDGPASRAAGERLLEAAGRRAVPADGRPDPWSYGETLLERIS